MKNVTQRWQVLVSLVSSFPDSYVSALLRVAWKFCASVKAFRSAEVTPKSFELFERRLERHGRQLSRLILQHAVNQVESSEPPAPVTWQDRVHLPVRFAWRTIDTRLGTIGYRRWVHQNKHVWVQPVAPLDQRLGLIGERVSPGIAHKLGPLAADQPQQSAIAQLRQQFGVRLSVGAYRRAVEHVSREIRFLHDQLAVVQLLQWVAQAREGTGKHEVLLLVGRDGVHVAMRPSWKEAACSTIAVYDRNRKRLGTVYLGEMPQKNQVTMTDRLTKVITDVLRGDDSQPLQLRYVTDAGGLPRGYFQKILSHMKHPLSGQKLDWSWGVDFFHACEYVSLLADTIFGTGTAEAQAWFREQRHSLRHDNQGVKKVLASAAEKKRRHGLKGSEEDYQSGKGYLNRYRSHMDYAARRKQGDPIGSGVTEAGCKVIFNQRMKQSGMRWKRASGQWIVDLRTAYRSRLWDVIWKHGLDDFRVLPKTNSPIPNQQLANA